MRPSLFLSEQSFPETSAKPTEVSLTNEIVDTNPAFYLDTDASSNLQDWENVKFNNLKYNLPQPSFKTGYARQAELYLKHGILK